MVLGVRVFWGDGVEGAGFERLATGILRSLTGVVGTWSERGPSGDRWRSLAERVGLERRPMDGLELIVVDLMLNE